jgi:RHH-type transcriptional regulator, proline utilization regulon repressor / proline dehydrogenase / delta 1-pyrroline-5-carboxylate dehydrogenase
VEPHPSDSLLERIRRTRPDDATLAREAVDLAAIWLDEARRAMRPKERRQAAQLARMMNDPAGKALTFALADQVFRPPSATRSARRFRDLVGSYGVPRYLPLLERAGMKLGAAVSAVLPRVVMPLVTAKLRGESASVILPGEDDRLHPHLDQRRRAGMRMNLNQLGEAILGEDEAEKRMQAVLARIASPDCDYLSVKISAIFSQIHLVARDETLARLKDRLRRLYRTAIAHPVTMPDGGRRPKFINLDMEEYRDLSLTRDVFTEVLDEPEFMRLEAGIVLQAYLPDAWLEQRRLHEWARERVARGGTGIKIRLVKGANLAMEKVEAAMHGWPQAPYLSKEEVDANFKRMLHEACRPENAAVVRTGVASHNLFDLAYTMLLRTREGVGDRIGFEMLEGMANHQARVVRAAAGDLLLYAPVVGRDDFHSAIAYLVRRLDENTSEENFLHDLFGMTPGSPPWESQKARFLRACARKDEIAAGPRRTQDRSRETQRLMKPGEPFANTADTDWSLPANVAWIRAKVEALRASLPACVPLWIGNHEEPGATTADGSDPSRPGTAAYRFTVADEDAIDRTLQVAADARAAWQSIGFDGRAALLRKAAATIAARRGEIIATMVLDAGKAVTEGDVEVSEAVDFANYYADAFSDPAFFDGSAFEPLGTVVVTPPWNFPFAIPCGGVLAALVAGNTVILKPATATTLTGWVLADCLWQAGIPREVLQFTPCANEAGRKLITDPRTGGVILTGGHDTARMFLGWKPELRLFAETSGKNALIITAAADPDQAVKDLVRSAFGHSGQKCSAASLAIVEAELHDHPAFLRQLRDAAASLTVGSPWHHDSIVTPCVTGIGPTLRRGLTALDPGESWLLEPKPINGNPNLWSPGIRIGVQPDSWYRSHECFGPVLGIIRARDLDHAIAIQNASSFGLTGGIHSLDPEETARWMGQVEIGNAYINRPITGAIVRRQPFGGWKNSSFGPGAKAGGPNYGALFGTWRNTASPSRTTTPSPRVARLLETLAAALPDTAAILQAAAASDAAAWRDEFSVDHDPSALFCESNVFRYRPFARCIVRANQETDDTGLARILLGAACTGTAIDLSCPEPRPFLAAAGIETHIEDEDTFIRRIRSTAWPWQGLRAPHARPELKAAATAAGLRLVDQTPLWNGRLELLWLLREQAVSETLHRHGSVLPATHTLA